MKTRKLSTPSSPVWQKLSSYPHGTEPAAILNKWVTLTKKAKVLGNLDLARELLQRVKFWQNEIRAKQVVAELCITLVVFRRCIGNSVCDIMRCGHALPLRVRGPNDTLGARPCVMCQNGLPVKFPQIAAASDAAIMKLHWDWWYKMRGHGGTL